ncbi:MAG: hypothetical protein AMXMBFR47_27080 [Planctomycetota bacterium]
MGGRVAHDWEVSMAQGSLAGFWPFRQRRAFPCARGVRFGSVTVAVVAVVAASLLSATATAAATFDDRKDLTGIVTDAGGKPLKDVTVIISTAAVRRGTSPY